MPATIRELVLVGGGHAHVQVLRDLLMRPIEGLHTTVVLDDPVAVYSGMVPGVVAGDYAPADAEIDVRPLARRAGASVVVARATRVDPGARTIELEGRAPLRYDLASLNTGSTVAGLDTPGVREHALATRPIGRFVGRLVDLVARARAAGSRPFRGVVVGGGAAGVELAFTVRARLVREGVREPRVTLVEGGPRILPGRSERLVALALEAARARGIEVVTCARVERVTATAVEVAGRPPLDQDVVLWATGASAHTLARDSRLACDARGFVRVGPTLEVVGARDLHAAGDMCVLEEWPEIPKAGVYAVREGAVLARNLRARILGARLRRYRPQHDFLALLNLGEGTALGAKWGLAVSGAWVWRWKDRIDRRFVRMFQLLRAGEYGGSEPLPGLMPAAAKPMEAFCGGCAAKVGATALERALGRLELRPDPDVVLGLANPDDVSAVRRGGELVVASVDSFPGFTDDPWLTGRVAAANALSDLEAKGVPPRFALALVTVPRGAREGETLFQVLSGARATLDARGVTLVGGHSTVGPELAVGFSVTGFAPGGQPLLTKAGLRPGDRLILTRALGTGVLFHADMKGLAPGRAVEAAVAGMVRGNVAPARIARELGALAATDVTGFGLATHVIEMLRAGSIAAEIDLASLPALPSALELLAVGVRSTAHEPNRAVLRLVDASAVSPQDPRLELLFDPQTAGGLVFGVPADRADEAVRRLHEAGEPSAAAIGWVNESRPGASVLRLRPGNEGSTHPRSDVSVKGSAS